MDWLGLLKKTKQVSPLDMGKQDIAYQAWELGRVVARIFEVCSRLRAAMADAGSRDEISALIGRGHMLVLSLKSLYVRLGREKCGVFSDIEDISGRIDRLCWEVKEGKDIEKLANMDSEIAALREILACELRSQSVHLSNIFNFSFLLRKLKAELVYDTGSDEIPGLISEARRILDRLRRGDKVLASPNLELTRQNLDIIDYRLKTIAGRLDDIRDFAKTQPVKFRREVTERCDLWTNLILDLLNPSDYLSMRWRFWAKAVIPLVICYFLVITPVFFIVRHNLVKALADYYSALDSTAKQNVWAISLALIPFVAYLYYLIFHYFRTLLMKLAFRCKIPHFKHDR